MTTNPTPPASPDRIAEAIAKLGGHEKARKIIAKDFGCTFHWEDDCIRTLALSAIDAHDPERKPDGYAYYLGTVALLSQIDNQLRNLRTPQPTPAAEEPAAAAPDADSEEVVEQGPSTPTSPERPQGRQLLAQFLDWMNAEFPIDPNYDRFAAIRAGARELLSRISAAKEAT